MIGKVHCNKVLVRLSFNVMLIRHLSPLSPRGRGVGLRWAQSNRGEGRASREHDILFQGWQQSARRVRLEEQANKPATASFTSEVFADCNTAANRPRPNTGQQARVLPRLGCRSVCRLFAETPHATLPSGWKP